MELEPEPMELQRSMKLESAEGPVGLKLTKMEQAVGPMATVAD